MVARKFQDWDVAILERFDAGDVGLVQEEADGLPGLEEKEVVGQEKSSLVVKN